MPKIEVNEELFYTLTKCHFNNREEFELSLECAKAELDEDSDKSLPKEERILKIELNDTNRPDLWSTSGCARQIRLYNNGKNEEYSFFSKNGEKANHKVIVEESVKEVRPFLAGFIAKGKKITDVSLKDIIQTQEKLAWNFGRKRRSVSMGLYRSDLIEFPIIYKAVSPDSISFVPLQWDTPLTLNQILKEHPKGKEYAFILEKEKTHPLLTDVKGNILSYPPIINSADLGAVKVGDENIFVELTGTHLPSVTLSASIVACDLFDMGYEIEPVTVEYNYNTIFGKTITFPYYFQEKVFCSLNRVEKFLGEKLSVEDCISALKRMGVKAEKKYGIEKSETIESEGIEVAPPVYRNDFLHASDIIEDIMIGRGLSSFSPQRPRDFTVGRLNPITIFSRKIKEILLGMGYQEMIYNYLGSKKDFVEKMRGNSEKIIRISNPMTENHEYLRDSILSSLLISESVSGHAVYPHRIFEIGKVSYRKEEENYGTLTRQYLGFLTADRDSNFNTVSAQIQTLFYYISCEYKVEETDDPRFISGRVAKILYKGNVCGIFGEIHPEVLENWDITVPCIACELDLDMLIQGTL